MNRKLVLSIGIGNFEDMRWPKLQFVEKDAASVYQALKNNFDGGWLLTPQSAGNPVTRQSVLDANAQLEKENKSENDTIVIYFSGHAARASGPRPETGGLGLRKFLAGHPNPGPDFRSANKRTRSSGISTCMRRFLSIHPGVRAFRLTSMMMAVGGRFAQPQQDISAQKQSLALGKHEEIGFLSRRASGIQTL